MLNETNVWTEVLDSGVSMMITFDGILSSLYHQGDILIHSKFQHHRCSIPPLSFFIAYSSWVQPCPQSNASVLERLPSYTRRKDRCSNGCVYMVFNFLGHPVWLKMTSGAHPTFGIPTWPPSPVRKVLFFTDVHESSLSIHIQKVTYNPKYWPRTAHGNGNKKN